METQDKIVEFDKWCHKCHYYDTEETEEPCNDCLTDTVNTNSHRPSHFKEDISL